MGKYDPPADLKVAIATVKSEIAKIASGTPPQGGRQPQGNPPLVKPPGDR